MSEKTAPKLEPARDEPQVLGILAEFSGPEELVDGARAIRDKGYRKVEAFSPFPIHGIDEALAAPRPILPWVVLGAGLTGCVVALLMQWYMNAFEANIPFSGYKYAISGKPYWSLPANIPVTFELIILFSAFTAFLGMIAFNKLPQLSNPLFRNERFLKATDNKFFLYVEADDPQFAPETVTSAFQSIGSNHVEPLYDLPNDRMPGYIVPAIGILAVVLLLPLGAVSVARSGTSETPRLSIWWDMDYQAKYKAQTLISPRVFEDGRAMRLPVEGTVARGRLTGDPALHLGYIPEDQQEVFETALQQGAQEEGSDQPEDTPPERVPPENQVEDRSDEAATDQPSDEQESEMQQEEPEAADAEGQPAGQSPAEGQGTAAEGEESATDEPATQDRTTEDAATDEPPTEGVGEGEQDAAGAPAEPIYPWVEEFPEQIEVNAATMNRGRERYNIYCAACHGLAGDGDGLVALRAVELQQPTWRPPTSLHQANIVAQPVGKIYDTITNGNLVGKGMRGGMPGYKEQISLKDRWAIVLYVKALQKTRSASPDELHEQELASLQ